MTKLKFKQMSAKLKTKLTLWTSGWNKPKTSRAIWSLGLTILWALTKFWGQLAQGPTLFQPLLWTWCNLGLTHSFSVLGAFYSTVHLKYTLCKFSFTNLAIRHLFVLFNVPCQVVSRLMPRIKMNKQRIILKHVKKENNKLERVSMSLCLFIMIIAMCLMRQSYVTYQLVEPMWFV